MNYCVLLARVMLTSLEVFQQTYNEQIVGTSQTVKNATLK